MCVIRACSAESRTSRFQSFRNPATGDHVTRWCATATTKQYGLVHFRFTKTFFEKWRIGFSQIRYRTFDFTESDARKKPFLNALTRPAL
jgi:hypothetical protein